MKIFIPTTLQELASHLSKPIYLVGGFVRNNILFGYQDDTDMDICGALTPDEIVCELSGIAEIKAVNPRIGTVLIKYKDGEFEYTTFRQDSYPVGGQHQPSEVVFVKDLSADVKRRDFTVNAVYAEVTTGEVIDLVSGLDDMKNKLIRTVRKPLETFSEDGLRLLRLVRFACELGFEIEAETERGAKESADQLLDISGERKREELNKIINSDLKYSVSGKPSYGLNLMAKLGLWRNVNVFEPILQAMEQKTSEYEFLDKVSKMIRLEVFAIILCGKEDFITTERVFGQCGLRYPKSIVKNIHTAIDFVNNPRANEDLMMFIAKNRHYVQSLDELSRAYGMGLNISGLYNEMINEGLPFEAKDLNITDDDFIRNGVKNKQRGLALNEILLETYRQKRNLEPNEKQAILSKYGEE